MIRITDQYIWNTVFSIFFLVLFVMGLIILDTEAHKSYTSLTVLDIIILTLASFRVMHLCMYEPMTKFIREQFYDAKVTKAGKVTLYTPERGPRRTLVDLMTCPWCFGIWSTSIVIFFYLLTPLAYLPILVLAVSVGATYIQKIFLYIDSKIV